jgi:hypothetical protein
MTPRRGVFWPLLLIVIGLVFLLANLGYIAPVSALALFSLWPIILILVGIDIAFARRWPLGVLALDVLIIAFGVALVASQPTLATPFGPVVFFSRSDRPVASTVSVPRGDAKSMTLHLNGGAGTFRIAGGGNDLLKATSDQENLSLRSSGGPDRLDVRIDQNDRGVRFGGGGPTHIDISIPSEVATSFDMNAGAGEFVVDFTDVKLTDARMSVGAASLRIVLPKTATGDVGITVNAGASSVVVEVPEGVEARITTSGAIISLKSENSRVANSETSGYSSAKDRVTVRITAGASSVVIR